MRRLATVIGISSVLVGLAGVSTAAVQSAGAGKHYTACATKSGTLSLEKHGKCAKHSKKVTIAAAGVRGPKGTPGGIGPAGPGAVTTSVTRVAAAITSGPAVATGIAGVTVGTVCDGGVAKVEVNGAATYTVQGPVNTAVGSDGGAAHYGLTANTPRDFANGANALSIGVPQSSPSQFFFSGSPGSSSTTSLTGQVIVAVATAGTFEMTIGLQATAAGGCSATAVVTPTTTAAGSS